MKRFVDTNILVYTVDREAGDRHERAKLLIDDLITRDELVISTQVLQEFFAVLTRRFRTRTPEWPLELTRFYARFATVGSDADVVLNAAQRALDHQISIWDSLIVEAALTAGCKELLTEDLQHGQVFGTLTIRNPFL